MSGNKEGVVVVGPDPVWRCVTTLGGFHERCVYDVDWNHSSGLIATAGGDDAVRVFAEGGDGGGDSDWRCETVQYSAHDQDVNCVRWNPVEEGELATASDDGTIKIWTLQGE